MIAAKLNALYLEEARKEAGSSEPWFPRASGIGGCLREQAHIAKGMERRPLSGEAMRVFELGTQRGIALAALAKKAYPDALTELEVSLPLPGIERPLLGHLDVWIPSERTLIDFKTSGVYKVGLLKAGAEAVGEDYAFQVEAYRQGMALKTGLAPSEIKAWLVFESKDTDARKGVEAGELLEVEVPYDPKLERRVKDRLAALALIVEARDQGFLDPTLIAGLPKTHWKCRVDANGRPRFCSIGPVLGKCHPA